MVTDRRWQWVVGLLLAVVLLAGWPQATWAAESGAGLTEDGLVELTGPLQVKADPQGSVPANWTVAGIQVAVSNATPVDERVSLAVVGAWVRVDGSPDGNGGLIAHRIKVLPARKFVKVEGPLDSLTDTEVVVGGLSLVRSAGTVVIGSPAVGARVEVKAALQSGNALLALVVEPEEEEQGDPVRPPQLPGAGSETELLGIIQQLPAAGFVGEWRVSGVPVDVTGQTEIQIVAGQIVSGTWVEVEGTGTGDGRLAARQIKTIAARTTHKLEGTLDSLDETTVVVDGIPVARDENTVIDGAPAPGLRVEVLSGHPLQSDGSMLAVKIDVDREQPAPEQHPNLVRFVALVESLPVSGTVGTWVVSGRPLSVTADTEIDQHKKGLAVGVLVQVRAVADGDALRALEIRVLPAFGHGGSSHGDHGGNYTEFKGLIESLPGSELIGLWVVAGRSVSVTLHTEIESRQAMTVGALVKVEGHVLPDGVVRATEIELEDESNDLPDEWEVHVQGVIQSRPTEGSLGTWEIGGHIVEVVAGTQIDEQDGPAVVDALVKVEGILQADDTILARKIEVLGSGSGGDGGEDYARFKGVVIGLPGSTDRLGIWTIRGSSGVEISVAVSADTWLMEPAERPIGINDWVEVEGAFGVGGTVIAYKIEWEDDPHGDHDGTVEFYGQVQQSPGTQDGVGLWIIRTGSEISRTVEADGSTFFEDGIPAVGERVEVKGRLQQNGTILALAVERENEGSNGGEGTYVEFEGQVTDASVDSAGVGQWQIQVSGELVRTVITTATTKFEDGIPTVGEQVRVKGVEAGDGVVTAQSMDIRNGD